MNESGKIYRNYHTHTRRCLHAQNTDEEYVLQAIASGYDTLGFSDHTPWPYPGGFKSACRMPADQLEDYVASIRRLQAIYDGRLKIHLGLECEYYPQFYDWLRAKRDRYGMEFLILGNHFLRADEQDCHFSYTRDADQLQRYADMAIAAMETGLFAYLAHPDVALSSYSVFDSAAEDAMTRICQASLELGFPLEFNLQGKLYQTQHRYDGLEYPCLDFWRLAGRMGCTGIVGVDAHAATSLGHTDWVDEGQRLMAEFGLKVVDQIPMAM